MRSPADAQGPKRRLVDDEVEQFNERREAIEMVRAGLTLPDSSSHYADDAEVAGGHRDLIRRLYRQAEEAGAEFKD